MFLVWGISGKKKAIRSCPPPLLATICENFLIYRLKECVKFNLGFFSHYASLTGLGTVTEHLEKISTAVQALRLYSLMLCIKSFTKGHEVNGLNANQKTATWKRASIKRFHTASSELSLNYP